MISLFIDSLLEKDSEDVDNFVSIASKSRSPLRVFLTAVWLRILSSEASGLDKFE